MTEICRHCSLWYSRSSVQDSVFIFDMLLARLGQHLDNFFYPL